MKRLKGDDAGEAATADPDKLRIQQLEEELRVAKQAGLAFLSSQKLRHGLPSQHLLSAICILALQTHESPPSSSSSSSSPLIASTTTDIPSSAKATNPGGSFGPLSWPSQVDNRQNLLFTYGDCLLPFLLTCKTALALRDDVLLPFSISPVGPKKYTPLMTAVVRNDVPLVLSMCNAARGWNLDQVCLRVCSVREGYFRSGPRRGGTALTLAATLGRSEAAQILLDAGANPAEVFRFDDDDSGAKPQLKTSLREHPNIMKQILLRDIPHDTFFDETPWYPKPPMSKWSEERIFFALEYQLPDVIRAL